MFWARLVVLQKLWGGGVCSIPLSFPILIAILWLAFPFLSALPFTQARPGQALPPLLPFLSCFPKIDFWMMVRYGMVPVVLNTITAAYRMRLLLLWLAASPPLTRIMLVGEKEKGKGKEKKKRKKDSTYGTCSTPCGPLPYQYHTVLKHLSHSLLYCK